MYDIDKVYGVPKEEISCPGCGRKYGHHKTTVDQISQECSSCCKQQGRTEVQLVSATRFIEEVLEYKPFTF
jgi:4-hydroxy-3-methylbut-2-en-1-yl diphosphate synthase IspG/GcpE